MGALNIILLIIWALSAVATIILVLMHSGEGTGVSDMIASSMYNASTGSGVWEKNLNRLTMISSIVFGVVVLLMMLSFPLGSVG